MHRSPVSRALQFAPLCCSPRSGASKRETQLPQTALPVCGQSATTQENRPLVLCCGVSSKTLNSLLQSLFKDTQYHSPGSLQRHPLVLGKSFVHAPGRKTKEGGEMDTMSISGTSEPGMANMCRPAPQVFRPWLHLDIVQSRLVHRSFSPVP